MPSYSCISTRHNFVLPSFTLFFIWRYTFCKDLVESTLRKSDFKRVCVCRNWHWDEPSCGYEVCVVMYHQPSAPRGLGGLYMFQWNDDNCETKNNFICKYTAGTAAHTNSIIFYFENTANLFTVVFIFSTENPVDPSPSPSTTQTGKTYSVWLKNKRKYNLADVLDSLRVRELNIQWDSLNIMDAFHYRRLFHICAAVGSKWPQQQQQYRLTNPFIHTDKRLPFSAQKSITILMLVVS